MTINYARESVIDFTKPFMNLGIGILFKVSFLFCVPRIALLIPASPNERCYTCRISITFHIIGG